MHEKELRNVIYNVATMMILMSDFPCANGSSTNVREARYVCNYSSKINWICRLKTIHEVLSACLLARSTLKLGIACY